MTGSAHSCTPQPDKLRRRREFVAVQSNGERFARRTLVLLVARNQVDRSRVGITVSRKVGNAVVRNRVRRRLRELLRAQAQQLAVGFDYVVVARASSAQAAFATLEQELTWLLTQIQRWASRSAS